MNFANDFISFFSIKANERVAIDFKVNGKIPNFLPDGMTIDNEGNLYVACFGGSKVLKVDPK